MLADLDNLRFVADADVHKGGRLAGHLRRDAAGVVAFSYSAGYDGAAVASTLPLDGGTFARPGGGLPPFFAGLLPEGHRLSVLRRATKTSMDDELTLLLAVGADTPGDVQVVPAGESPTTPAPLVSARPGELDFAALTDAPDLHGIPGVQAKASATMLTVPVAFGAAGAILKIDPPGYPHLVANEAAHLVAARQLRIPVARAAVVHDRNGVPGLLVQRFDRAVPAPAAPTTRLAMEDASQALNILPAAKYAVAAEDAVLALTRLTKAPAVAARNFYLQFVFAWLTGNGDLHAKNVAVLADPQGGFVASPVYDIPCTALYGDMTLALPVAGRTKNLRLRHWDEFADSIGLPRKAARSANASALKAAGRVVLASLPFEGSPLHGAEREIRHRRGELAD